MLFETDECRVRSVNSSLGVPESGGTQTRLGRSGKRFSFPRLRDPEFSFYRDLAEIGQKRAGHTISPFFAVHGFGSNPQRPLPFPAWSINFKSYDFDCMN